MSAANQTAQAKASQALSASTAWRVAPAAQSLSGSAIREILKLTERPDILSFAGGLPSPAAFPVDAVRQASDRVLSKDPISALQYGPTEGFGPLREQVAARLSAAGQTCTADNILITTGSQQALDLAGKALLSPGDTVLAANPSYLGALQAFALYQPKFQDISHFLNDSVPEYAGRPDGKSAAQAAFCYMTPTFANPSGETLSQDARQHLINRLNQANIPLVEDDPYSALWLDEPPPAACQSLSPENTLYLGSFSKVLTPGLRVGYLAGPHKMIQLLARLKQATDLHTPGLNQRIVSALISDGTLDQHLPELRSLYRGQRDALLAALKTHFTAFADWQAPAGGMFVWLKLHPGITTAQLFAEAIKHGVAFVPGAPFYFSDADPQTLRLAYSTVAIANMDEGMRRLARAARECQENSVQ